LKYESVFDVVYYMRSMSILRVKIRPS